MAAALLGTGVLALRQLFKYNRGNYTFDRKLKQKCAQQEQNLRVEQFALYREDVRDLVELTSAKMEVYMVACALLVDRATVMITKVKEALPVGSPDWVIALNAMSLASGVFYLLLCLWLAMYASIAAQSYGTRMLTQFVRLPIASQAHIARAAATGADFEGRGLGAMFRVPFLPSSQAGFHQNEGTASAGTAGARQQERQGAETTEPLQTASLRTLPSDGTFITATQAEELTKMPTAMLEHIRYYRKMQLNWQAYDAYARVCLFAGVNSFLYCCMYWSLGSFLKGQKAVIPAFGVALIFSTIQVVLTKLDLYLDRAQVIRISVLLATTPLLTTAGMLLFQIIDDNNSVRWHLSWQRIVMRACAVATHALHTVVAMLMLKAATPEKSTNPDDNTLLPAAFHSTLFLDVFGWLLNSGGPGLVRGRDQDDGASEGTYPDGASDVGSPRGGSEFNSHSPTGRQPRSRAGSGTSNPTSSRGPGSAGRNLFSGSASDAGSLSSRSTRQSRRPGLASSARTFTREIAESFTGNTDTHRSRRQPTARIDLGREVQEDAQSFTHVGSSGLYERPGETASSSQVARPDYSSDQSDAQQVRYGGADSLPAGAFATINESSAEGSAHFVNAGVNSIGRPRFVDEDAERPGEQPWSAFRRGTQVIIVLWALSTVWTIYSAVEDLMAAAHKPGGSAFIATPELQRLPLSDGHFLAGPLCNQQALRLRQEQHYSKSEDMSQQLRWLLYRRASKDYVLLDTGCGAHTAPLDVSADCRVTPNAPGRQCSVAVLQRGGRTVSLCSLWQHGRVLRLRPLARMRLVPGLPALRSLAIQRQEDQPDLTGLQLFGRAGGALLALRVQLGVHATLHGSKLMPVFEVEAPVQGEASVTPSMDNERLLVSAGTLLSLQPMLLSEEEIAAGSQLTCSSGFKDGLRLRAWDLATGEQSEHRVPIPPSVLGARFRSASSRAVGLLQTALCQGTVEKATA